MPGQETLTSADEKRTEEDFKTNAVLQAQATQANSVNQTTLDLLHRLPSIAAGSGTEWRNNLIRLGDTWLSKGWQEDMKDYLHLDFSSARDRDAAVKESTKLALQQEAQMGGVHGIGLAEMNAHASPHAGMPEETISDLLHAGLVSNQAVLDHAQGLTAKLTPRYMAWRNTKEGGMPAPYVPASPELEAEWKDPKGIHAPAVYQLATDALNGRSADELTKWYGKLTSEQRAEAEAIIRRVDPQWVPAGHQKPAAAAP
jgi:hypothetical protein